MGGLPYGDGFFNFFVDYLLLWLTGRDGGHRLDCVPLVGGLFWMIYLVETGWGATCYFRVAVFFFFFFFFFTYFSEGSEL